MQAVILNVEHGLGRLAWAGCIIIIEIVIYCERYIALVFAEAALLEVLVEQSPIQMHVAFSRALSVLAPPAVTLVGLVSRNQPEVV